MHKKWTPYHCEHIMIVEKIQIERQLYKLYLNTYRSYWYLCSFYRDILSFVLVQIIQREVHTFKNGVWNVHSIRAQKTQLSNRIPNHIYDFQGEYHYAKICRNTEFFRVHIFPYSVQIWENTDQKKLGIWTLFTQCITFANVVSTFSIKRKPQNETTVYVIFPKIRLHMLRGNYFT